MKRVQNDFPFAVCNVRNGRKHLTLLSFFEAQMTSKLSVCRVFNLLPDGALLSHIFGATDLICHTIVNHE